MILTSAYDSPPASVSSEGDAAPCEEERSSLVRLVEMSIGLER